MPNKEKNINIIVFSGKVTDWESWSQKFLSCSKQKGYKKLLVSSGSTSDVDKIPMQEEYENALKGHMHLNKKTLKLGELNEYAHQYQFLK